MSQEAPSPTPHQQPPSPPPSPSGPTTSELRREPPPVRKDTARQHELQDPSSPKKPSKLFRTQSGLQMPLIDIGDSFLAVPVSLNGMSVLADPTEVEEALPTPNTTDKGKGRKDPNTSSDKPPLDPKKCPLMRSSRKKGSKSDVSSLLTAPPACRKLDIDPAKSDDKENAMCPLEYGIFVMDD